MKPNRAPISSATMMTGMAGSFVLLWSTYSLARLSEKLDSLHDRIRSFDTFQASVQKELDLLEHRLSLLEQRLGSYGKP